jgi:DUF917 family protein
MGRSITSAQLEDIAVGAAVLGSGGGGDPYIGKLLTQHAIERHGVVKVFGLDELDDDELVIPVAGMGAPTVGIEKLEQGEELVRAFQALEQYLGRRARAVMPIEAGGGNSTAPFLVAATLGLPLIDCDAMGRAFPELQMVTCGLYGISATPMAMADERGNVLILNCISNQWTERLARAATIDMGCVSHIALYSMTGRQLKQAVIPGTISLCESIGQAIRQARYDNQSATAAVAELTDGVELFRGRVVDVQRATVTGFARGHARLEGLDAWADQACMVVKFQNEYLVAQVGERVVCATPDLIVMLDAETGQPVTTEALRYGFRIAVIGIPCDWRWRTPEALALIGPRYFGYDFDYAPVEEINRGIYS